MARRSRESFFKRQRERDRAEKAARKRQKREERRSGVAPEEGAPEEGAPEEPQDANADEAAEQGDERPGVESIATESGTHPDRPE